GRGSFPRAPSGERSIAPGSERGRSSGLRPDRQRAFFGRQAFSFSRRARFSPAIAAVLTRSEPSRSLRPRLVRLVSSESGYPMKSLVSLLAVLLAAPCLAAV